MATHSSVLAWRIPGVGEPGGLPSRRVTVSGVASGVTQSRTRLKRLISSMLMEDFDKPDVCTCSYHRENSLCSLKKPQVGEKQILVFNIFSYDLKGCESGLPSKLESSWWYS